MLEKSSSKNEANKKKTEEYSETVLKINNSLMSLFPNVERSTGWLSDETETPDGYTIIRGYDIGRHEGTLTIEKNDEHLEETITYNFKIIGKGIRKEGYRNRKNYSSLGKPVYFTDDMKTMDDVEKANPRCAFAPSIIVSLEELKIVERIVSDPVASGIFASLPILRLPPESVSIR